MTKITIFRILVCFFILPQLKWTLFHLTRAFFVSANTDAIRLKNGRTFEIDYTGHRFLKNGQDYRYISGEIHYFRIHSSLWEDRLMRVRHAGLNAVQVYVPWNLHEVVKGRFEFSGEKDLAKFIKLAQKADLDVLLRIGPYVCAEWENGGIPWWLLNDKDIGLRTSEPQYLAHVKRWFDALLPIIQPLMYENGGPILMLQIENEYGSMGICDKIYLAWLRDEVRRQLGKDTVLYTTDGNSEKMVQCGSIDGTLTTVDFGEQGKFDDVKRNFELQDKYSQGGPRVNSEFYTMWFSMWGDQSPVLANLNGTVRNMDWIWTNNGSLSLYMIHGGSNFGFWNGAETDGPVLTTYDYSAPISEEGQITPLYMAIREWINSLTDWSHKPLEIPKNRSGVEFEEKLPVQEIGNLLMLANQTIDVDNDCIRPQSLLTPQSFEALPGFYNFVLYSIIVPVGGRLLAISKLRDYAYVYVDGVFQGQLSLCDKYTCAKNITFAGEGIQSGQRLDLIVESYGRLTYPMRNDPVPFKKGILSNVTLDGQVLAGGWKQCGIDIDKVYSSAKHQMKLSQTHFHNSINKNSQSSDENVQQRVAEGPTVYATRFQSKEGIKWDELHTFFDSRDWRKGVILVNGFNVGRYWPERGPQMALFVPGAVFNSDSGGMNTVVLLELIGPSANRSVNDNSLLPSNQHNSDRHNEHHEGRNMVNIVNMMPNNESNDLPGIGIHFVRNPIYVYKRQADEQGGKELSLPELLNYSATRKESRLQRVLNFFEKRIGLI